MMTVTEEHILRVEDQAVLEGGEAEIRLKRQLGRGIYIHEVNELPDGDIEIVLGNVVPRNLSDCREQDKVLKFVTLRDVYTLRGEATDGYYHIRLPERDEVLEGIKEREDEILDKLDYSMAQAIYANVYDLPDVRTQLNPILELLRWVRREGRTTQTRLVDAQRSEKTLAYLRMLENMGYVRRENHEVEAGERLQSADLNEMGREEFGRAFLGDVVQRGYYTIRDQFDMSMLGHYQKYAGAYYYDAIQRGEHGLWLDIETVQENLSDQFDERRDTLYIEEKLADLSNVNVVEQDGEFVRGTSDVFDQVMSQTPAI
jgi:hypothetical protein